MPDNKQKYVDYLASHNLLSFATADDKGNPFVRSVEYVNDGPNVYFLTDAMSAKVKHIKNNSNVAFTVDENLADWSKIQGIQMRGKAFIVRDNEEKERTIEMLMSKFPQFAEMSSEGVEPCVVKIEPTAGIFIDNPSGAGTRYKIRYD
jgi:general stress protein 26